MPLVAALQACGGGHAAVVDAGATVASPVLTCAAGWREVPSAEPGGITSCDPWPEGGAQTCAVDGAHFPGEAGCVTVGGACGAGEWAVDLPNDRPIRYVRAGAVGGTGSQAAPFGTIAEAMSGAPSGTVVAVGKGSFDEPVVMGPGVTLWGACVAETTLMSSIASESDGVVTVRVAGAEVRNVRITGLRPGVWVASPGTSGASLHLEDVIVDGAAGAGVFVTRSDLTARSVVVRDTGPRGSDGHYGRAFYIRSGSHAEIRRAVISHNREAGLYVGDPGSTLVLEDAAVIDTQSEADQLFGGGLGVQLGAQADVTRVTFERNRFVTVFVAGTGAVARLTDVIVHDTRSEELGLVFGRALGVEQGGAATVTRAAFERNREVAIYAAGAGTTLALSDVIVRDTAGQEIDGAFGRGMSVENGAVATGARVRFERSRDVALFSSGAETSTTLTDFVAMDTAKQDCAAAGTCHWDITSTVGVYDDAHVDITRFALLRSAFMGLQLANGGALDLHDGTVGGNQIGANVQTMDFDVGRLQDGVTFVDNDVNFDGTTQPPPGANPSL